MSSDPAEAAPSPAFMDPSLAEAERRIEEALRTDAERLDLGDLALPAIPPRIGELERLRTLVLGRARLTADGELVWSNERAPP